MEPFSYNNSLLKGVFFLVGDVIFYFEKPPNTFSLHLEFKNLSLIMIFFIGLRCHLFLFHIKIGVWKKWITLNTH